MNIFHTAAPATTPFKPLSGTRRRLGIFWGLAAFLGLLALCPGYGSAAQYTVNSVPNVQLQDSSRYVSNPDNLITAEHELQINRLAGKLREQSGIELAVVAVKNIGDTDARQFANELFRHWGLGKKGKDNGLLILLVTQPPQRSIVFETGYGLEASLPDALCYRMQQEHMIPLLKKNEYSLAMLKGVTAVGEHFFSGEYKNVQVKSPGFLGWLFRNLSSVFIFLFVVVLIHRILKKRKTGPSRNWTPNATYSRDSSNDRRSSSGRSSGGSWGGGRSGGGGASSRF